MNPRSSAHARLHVRGRAVGSLASLASLASFASKSGIATGAAMAVACASPRAAPGDAGVAASDAGPQDAAPAPDAPSPPPDAGSDAFVVGPHAALPQVPNHGGPVLAHPRLVTISFDAPADAGPPPAGGIRGTEVSAFGAWIVGSGWLSAVGKDYGVGLGTHTHVTLPATLTGTVSDDQVQALLLASIGSGALPAPSGDAGAGNTLYEVFFPEGTTVDAPVGLGGGGDTCVPYGGGFLGGYHWQTTGPGPVVPYAVVPTCSGGGLVEAASDIEAEASHELIEASTDPLPATALGWAITDPNSPFSFLDGEVADLCSPEEIMSGGFTVQRVWSNRAAASLDNPCIPAPAGPFYDTTTKPAKVQTVMPGQTVTFEVQGFSNEPTAPWSIDTFAGGGTFDPAPTLDRKTLGNGQTATLTLTIPNNAGSQGYALVFVDSSRSADAYSYWPVAVETP